jgi:UDP-glucose 4-epimerase
MTEIIITGVAGFIGSNLATKLLGQGHKVIGIDNFSYGCERNMAAFRDHKNFVFVYGDIANQYALKGFNASAIVHLASQKIPRYTSALRTLDENYLMLRNIVNKCIEDRSKIIFSSTSDVYGKNSSIPFSEDSDLVLGPTTIKRWAYASSKIYGEQFIIANSEEYGLKYTIARFFGSYGINQNLTWWGGPQSVFISNSLKKLPLEIHGDGKQTRTFTYVDDTVDALIHCIFHERSENEIFNTGSKKTDEISIADLAKKIWLMINPDDDPLLNFIPYSTFGKYEDVMRRVPDITKLKKCFGFEPKWNLDAGLKTTIEWQRNL